MKRAPQGVAPRRRPPRRVVFRALSLLPLLFLLTLLAALCLRVVQIRALQEEELIQPLQDDLLHKPGEIFKTMQREGSLGFALPSGRFVPLSFKPSERVVFAFGGSSLVIEEDDSFTRGLQRRLSHQTGEPFRVVNFGHHGFDSFSVRQRVEESLKLHKPDLVIIYSGHNDYSYAYWKILNPHYYVVQSSAVLEPLLRHTYKGYRALRSLFTDHPLPIYHMLWLANVEPMLLRTLQHVGLIKVPKGLFERVDEIVMKHYSKNMHHIIQLTRRHGIPLLLVTPVSNLWYRPVGIAGAAEDLFQQAMAQEDRQRKTLLLQQARDADVFSGMIRAKTPLLDYLRSLEGPGVYLQDLEQELLSAGVALDDKLFSDAIHLSREMHELAAQHLARFILRRGICCGLQEEAR